MTTNSKKKKHALNPIIILSFIVIGLLFVILTIAMKENIDVNGSLRAGTYVCDPTTESKIVSGTDYVALTTKAPAYLSALSSAAATTLKNQFCFTQVRKDENALPCTDQKCESKTKTTIPDLPSCTASVTELTNDFPSPQPAAGTTFTVKFTGKLKATLRRTCVPKETASTSPVVYPICSKSGTRSQDCNPNSKGVFKAVNSAQATSPEGSNVQERAGLASAEAVRLAKDGLEAKCSALATNDPMYACTTPPPKSCDTGCKPNGKSIYKAPYTLIDKSGYPVIDPKITDCKLAAISATSTTVTMEAECYASCRYEQDCIPIETPSPSPIRPTTTPSPILTSPISDPFR